MKKFHLFDEFRNNTTKTLKNMIIHETNINNDMNNTLKDIKDMKQSIEQLMKDVNKFALRKDIHVLARELKAQQDSLEKCAQKSGVEEASAAISHYS